MTRMDWDKARDRARVDEVARTAQDRRRQRRAADRLARDERRPPTARQLEYLRLLARRLERPAPAVSTSAGASAAINQLKQILARKQ